MNASISKAAAAAAAAANATQMSNQKKLPNGSSSGPGPGMNGWMGMGMGMGMTGNNMPMGMNMGMNMSLNGTHASTASFGINSLGSSLNASLGNGISESPFPQSRSLGGSLASQLKPDSRPPQHPNTTNSMQLPIFNSPSPPPPSLLPSHSGPSTVSTGSSSPPSVDKNGTKKKSTKKLKAPSLDTDPSSPYSNPQNMKVKRKLRKNTREKQRRSELNDKFDRLCELLHLGRKAKAEKFTVLSEAVTTIETLRQENMELRQEKAELRNELTKLTTCLQNAFPAQPEFALELTSRFFPQLQGPPTPRDGPPISSPTPDIKQEIKPFITAANITSPPTPTRPSSQQPAHMTEQSPSHETSMKQTTISGSTSHRPPLDTRRTSLLNMDPYTRRSSLMSSSMSASIPDTRRSSLIHGVNSFAAEHFGHMSQSLHDEKTTPTHKSTPFTLHPTRRTSQTIPQPTHHRRTSSNMSYTGRTSMIPSHVLHAGHAHDESHPPFQSGPIHPSHHASYQHPSTHPHHTRASMSISSLPMDGFDTLAPIPLGELVENPPEFMFQNEMDEDINLNEFN